MMFKSSLFFNYFLQSTPKNINITQRINVFKYHSRGYSSATPNTHSRPRVVVLGSGWSSIFFVKHLNPKQFDLTVVSPRNYFTFTPLLPKIMSGMANSNTASEPFLNFMKKRFKDNSTFVHANCVDVDTKSNSVTCAPVDGTNTLFSLNYDYLVIGVGSKTNSFGIRGVEKYAFFLKEVEHAEKVFQRVLDNFIAASMPFVSDEERSRLLHFVVVGGGPTGVESAGELSVLMNDYLSKVYPQLRPFAKVSIVEGGKRLLPTLKAESSEYVSRVFDQNNVNMCFGKVVCEVRERSCVLKELATGQTEEIKCGLVLWASGLKENELVSKLQKRLNMPENSRALLVDQYLRLQGTNNVFCLGDCCRLTPTRLSDNLDTVLNVTGSPTLDALLKNRPKLARDFPQVRRTKWKFKEEKFKSAVAEIMAKSEGEAGGAGPGAETRETFLEILKYIDNTYTPPFPTAQNAKQEAIYLAKMFNNGSLLGGGIAKAGFGEHWKGTLASLGGYRVVMNSPLVDINGGLMPFLFWNTIYLILFTSCKMRALFLFDLVMSFFTNRHIISKSHRN
ncbi:NADH dehydrogenase [Theileria orientalis]|uniref:NADH:ubiquinone reductase (non-electrogenic) n=1 Tax=Theileria orientalis TaxID=68886 RepID=A0A976MAY2_THEOR|nr:NADH dehydrogenase [Theileria orientalis]